MHFKQGFSLLELLIVMAIIAILMGVAYPLYTSHLVKARRNQAEIDLIYLASQLESFYGLHDSYQGATIESLGVNSYTDDHSYQLSIQSLTDTGYLISASPLGAQKTADNHCGSLSLNEQGEKSANADSCWN